jgi:hypothetical protein
VGTNHLAASLSSVCLDVRGTPILSADDRMMLMGGGRVVDQGSIQPVMAGPGVSRLHGDGCRIEADAGGYRMHFVRS